MGKKTAYYGMFAALALLMGYIESLVPVPVPVPGIKLGLANVIILIVLYFMDARAAVFVSFIRVLAQALLFSGAAGFIYSAAGAGLSVLAMCLIKRFKKIGIIGVSVTGGVFHNIGQIAVAALAVSNAKLMYYLPVLIVSGVAAGIITGITARYCLIYLEKSNLRI